MTTLGFSVAMVTSAGGRERNEDACAWFTSEQGCCWVLCDGAGGHGGGDRAARLAVSRVMHAFATSPEVAAGPVADLVMAANEAVLGGQREGDVFADMRTTLVLLCARADHGVACWGNVGDSRLYLFRDGRLAYRTRDHSLVQQMVDARLVAPEDDREMRFRNILTSALGDERIEANLPDAPMMLRGGDAFLLCSDGFWDHVDDDALLATLAAASDPQDWLARCEALLLERVRPGHDNYTALAAWVNEEPSS